MVSAPGAEVCNDNASARSSSSSLTLLAVAPGYRGALPGSAGGGLDDGGTGKRNVYLRSISGALMQMLTLPPSLQLTLCTFVRCRCIVPEGFAGRICNSLVLEVEGGGDEIVCSEIVKAKGRRIGILH